MGCEGGEGGEGCWRSAPAQRLTSTKDALSQPSLPAATQSVLIVALHYIN